MCGIFCSINFSAEDVNKYMQFISQVLEKRGPDCSCTGSLNNVHFAGSVLWQRGEELQQQPVMSDKHGFLFNGDIFGLEDNTKESDTRWLFERLIRAQNEDEIITTLSTIKGPCCVIYYNDILRKLFVMRDSLGRYSLLISKIDATKWFFASAVDRGIPCDVMELPPLGIFTLDPSNPSETISVHPWKSLDSHPFFRESIKQLENFLQTNITLKEVLNPVWLGAIDYKSGYNFQSIQLDEHSKCNPDALFSKLLCNQYVLASCNTLIRLLSVSVQERVKSTPDKCKNCITDNSKPSCLHPRVGVLFSGGIDCTIIATLAHQFIDTQIPIDLLNVSFEKIQRKIPPIPDADLFESPDRLTARSSTTELMRLFPDRTWNLVEINVTRKELGQLLQDHISNLVYPLQTILDESIGAALWFAARGKGTLHGHPYQSPSRVLLIGSGADELLGGYTRHRNAFKRDPTLVKLTEELTLDWVRLPSRNLARDDRVISDHGVSPRAPFIQEDVVQFLTNLHPLERCYHQLDEGVGDKLLLRLCGFLLGLKDATKLKKRALQFGSRIADSKQNAKSFSQVLA